ncbi:non-ribosomal peptide synthetase [Actinoplanes derwentensis]|uniref:Amino acid adenylation domain-containing protein n=1 Tax=Actinoplanes derwentensis TaxID=113562 RepID=A0A1H2DDC3_9ACTN|nr:non-ribosomal peptide synthetase [Actinoplanes derwentensis]SDT80502.1 amino acid adenylation domain-containing protein [Actinoplanes derwentensis]
MEDIYPLTPMQQGMLFHTAQTAVGGPYLEQFVFTVESPVDLGHLRRAWDWTLGRHPALRSTFLWQDIDEPHQVVISRPHLDMAEFDHSFLDDSDHERRIKEFLAEDRERGFDVSSAPLMRFTAVRRTGRTVLIWTLHHLIIDGWSFPLVVRDAEMAYRAFASGGEPAAPPAAPFREFIAWLRRRDTTGDAPYWSDYLRDVPGGSDLAVEPGLIFERRGEAADGRAVHDLDRQTSARITQLAAAAGVTVGTVLQAAWALVLARHNDTDSAVYGLTMAGRPSGILGVERIVGPFINTIPRRATLDPARRIHDWLRELQTDRLDAEEFAYTSLIDIAKYAKRPADRKLFESILVIENYPTVERDDSSGDELHFRLRSFIEDTDYPLTMMVLFHHAATLRLQLLYDRQRYSAEVARTVLGRYEAALRSLTSSTTVADLDVVGEAARVTVLDEWNDTGAEAGVTPVHIVFDEQAGRTPEAVAVDDHGRLVTYAELRARSDSLAGELIGTGIGPESIVALLQRRSVDLLVSVLAVLKAGGAYLALDPDHPDPRLTYLLEDSGAKLLLTDATFADRLPSALPRLRVDVAGGTAVTAVRPEQTVSAAGLCYVTYTSGTTGRPKGIAMTHGSLTNLIRWQLRNTCVPVTGRTFAYASLSFDVSFQEIFATWTCGGTLVLVNEEERTDFERLVILARTARVQRWFLPAPALEQVAATAAGLGTALPDLLEIIPGSEPLHVTGELRRLLGAAPGCRLENQYGPSECHVVTSHVMTQKPDEIPEYPHIGQPLANTRAYVLDRELNPVPVGVTGELYLAGAGVARGYLGRPGLTADRFLPCPFGDRPGARMYVTGDRARLRSDGGIEFLGRRDSQVKIRGFRVELGEVEAALREQPEVREAVVLLRTTGDDKVLVGYVVAAEHPIDTDMVLDRLRRTLPAHLVPWTLVVLDEFPLNVNRKVDRSALPMPQVAERVVESPPAESSPAESLMTRVWASVLCMSAVGLDDDFFHLGGHSLSALRLAGQLRVAFSVPVGVGAVFAQRTPRRLLNHIIGESGGSAVVNAAVTAYIEKEDQA